jgi:GT2 family glycosyltransferase
MTLKDFCSLYGVYVVLILEYCGRELFFSRNRPDTRMSKMGHPLVTVVISTRNRGVLAVKTVQTILQNDFPHFGLTVIDQSEDDDTKESLRPLLVNRRIHYIKTATKGLSTGLNLGITESQSDFIAIIDDDCEAPTDWLRNLVSALLIDHHIGVVFGNVLPGSHDRAGGFIPAYIRERPLLVRNLWERHKVEGMGACMGLRRAVWQELSGFDEMLGPGAPFEAANDIDFSLRTLIAGYFVYVTPSVTVIHQGFRTWEQGLALIRGYLYGLGAMHVKHLKCGHWAVLHYFLHLMWRWAFKHPAIDFGHQPSRLLRLEAFLRGFLAGALNPVDKVKSHYVRSKMIKIEGNGLS